MFSRRRAVNLTDYKSVLSTTGEVSVGAFARQQRRKRIFLALGGVALIVAAGWVYSLLAPLDGQRAADRRVLVECTKCGERETRAVPADARFPLMCEKCGERTCREVWKCEVCKREFLQTGGVVQCPNPGCRSRQVGSAAGPGAR